MTIRHLALLALVLAPSIPRPTGACSPPSSHDGPHAIDPAFANDTVAPSAVTLTSVVEREPSGGDNGGGLCAGEPVCTGFTPHVYLSVIATDNQTPTPRMGYTFTLVAGALPQGTTLPVGPVLATYGDIMLRFDSTAGDIDYTLEVRAIDLNGNVGPPSTITISDPG